MQVRLTSDPERLHATFLIPNLLCAPGQVRDLLTEKPREICTQPLCILEEEELEGRSLCALCKPPARPPAHAHATQPHPRWHKEGDMQCLGCLVML